MVTTKDVFGKPRDYKGLLVHPIRMSEAEEFYEAVQCLMISKNATQDIEVLKMSYLRFLIIVMHQEPIFETKLVKLFELIFKTSNLQVREDERGQILIIIDDEHIIRERDFDKIKTIISEQNLVDLNDEYINPEVKAKIDEARVFMSKQGNKVAGLDQQIVAYHCKGFTYEIIENLTIYQFQKGLSRFDHILGAEAILNARYGGMVEFKDDTKMPHWLGHIEENNDDGLLLDAEKFKTKATKELGMSTN